MSKLKRFSALDIETIKWMAARGHDGVAIAQKLKRTPQAVRVKCVELGISLKPMPSKDRLRILFERPFYEALIKAAKTHGTTAPKLARLILVIVLSDKMVKAILDVPVGKAKPIRRVRQAR
jgi:hypothetical protein